LEVDEVAETFHARFSATGRSYRYLLLNREAPDPFLAATAWHYPHRIEIDPMNAASAAFVGEQDFASLCRRAEGRRTTRDVLWARWRRNGDLVEFSVAATAFCHQMVRSMVAIAVDVGRGRIPTDSVAAILEEKDRTAGRGAAPAHGLTLVEVSYPGRPLSPPEWVMETS
jgi:tRNA pseudouridine38-40 synthase